MIRLSAFADEISAIPEEQIAVLQENGVGAVDLRGAWNVNVLDLTNEQAKQLRTLFTGAGITVAAIASPIGKTPIDASRTQCMNQFETALALARAFDTRTVRLFSFYAPQGEVDDPAFWRDEAISRLQAMAERAGEEGVTLVHENEKGIYGDTAVRCVDLLETVGSPALRAAFDPANFIQCGETPYPDAYEALAPWIASVHVKDALTDGSVVVAGAGESRWPDTLTRLHADGFAGYLSLEPHLAAAGPFGGFTGAERFREAASALQRLLHDEGWEYA